MVSALALWAGKENWEDDLFLWAAQISGIAVFMMPPWTKRQLYSYLQPSYSSPVLSHANPQNKKFPNLSVICCQEKQFHVS